MINPIIDTAKFNSLAITSEVRKDARKQVNKESKERLLNVSSVFKDLRANVLSLPNRVTAALITLNVINVLLSMCSASLADKLYTAKSLNAENISKCLRNLKLHLFLMTDSQRLSYLMQQNATTTTKLVDCIIKAGTLTVDQFKEITSKQLPTFAELLTAKVNSLDASLAKISVETEQANKVLQSNISALNVEQKQLQKNAEYLKLKEGKGTDSQLRKIAKFETNVVNLTNLILTGKTNLEKLEKRQLSICNNIEKYEGKLESITLTSEVAPKVEEIKAA